MYLLIDILVHLGLHQDGKAGVSTKGGCNGGKEAVSGSMARILRHTKWEVYRQAIPASPNMDDCWLLNLKDAFGEPSQGVFAILGGGLRAS